MSIFSSLILQAANLKDQDIESKCQTKLQTGIYSDTILKFKYQSMFYVSPPTVWKIQMKKVQSITQHWNCELKKEKEN